MPKNLEIRSIKEAEERLGFSLSRYYHEPLHDHAGLALNSVLRGLREHVKNADPLAISDACELIALDPRFIFGKATKSNLARALKGHAKYIPPEERKKIVAQTARMLSLEYCPTETAEYCRLVRKLGQAECANVLRLAEPVADKARKLVAYLEHGGT